MHSVFQTLPTALLLAAFATADVHAQSDIKDTVLLTNGKRIRGVEVTEMSSSTVKWKRGDVSDERPSSAVASITWHETPESLALGRAALKNGSFDDAIAAFEKAASEASRDFVRQEAEFLAGEATLRGAGDDATKAGNAAARLREFVGASGESYWGPEARLLLGQAEMAAGNAAAAEQALSQLSTWASAQGLGAVWDIRAKFGVAQAQLEQGKLADARTTFGRTKSAAETALTLAGGKDAEIEAILAQAVVGEGETLVAEGKFGEAVRYFENLARGQNTAVVAAAKAGHGQAIYLQAEASGKKDDLRRAQILLAEANLSDPLAGETTAKALYFSGKVLLALGPELESQDFQVRANEYFRTVAEFYKDTPWAARAAAELD